MRNQVFVRRPRDFFAALQGGDFEKLMLNTIGFGEDLAGAIEHATRAGAGYPPHDIEQQGDHFRVSIAVSGFRPEHLSVETQAGVLLVQGRIPDSDKPDASRFVHKGIATRSFIKRFHLGDHIEVTGARLENGLLAIDLKREVPEEMKPRAIPVHAESIPALTQESAEASAED
jgi:molecular chaperone IbpA